MTVLVTGGAGYIGSHMVLELLDAGEKIVVLDNLSTGRRAAVPPAAELVVGDFGDEALVEGPARQPQCRRHHPFRGENRGAGLGRRPARLLPQQHRFRPQPARLRGRRRRSRISSFPPPPPSMASRSIIRFPRTKALKPVSPYGRSKLMVEWMLEDMAQAHDLHYVVLRYFNVAGADPKGRTGQSFPNATHLIKVAVQAALGMRKGMEVFGTDYPTPDGSCLRDYIQVTRSRPRPYGRAASHLRGGGESLTVQLRL